MLLIRRIIIHGLVRGSAKKSLFFKVWDSSYASSNCERSLVVCPLGRPSPFMQGADTLNAANGMPEALVGASAWMEPYLILEDRPAKKCSSTIYKHKVSTVVDTWHRYTIQGWVCLVMISRQKHRRIARMDLLALYAYYQRFWTSHSCWFFSASKLDAPELPHPKQASIKGIVM